jgi:hypothetical protein
VLLGGITAVLVLLGLEAMLQVAARVSDRVAAVVAPGIPRTLADPRLGHRPNPAVPGHDAAGWRNAARPERAAVVALGDSQTYGDEVTREEAWPQRLGSLGGATPYNMALGGYGPARYWLLVDEALALEPDLLLVGFYAGNDLADAYAAVHLRGLDPSLRATLEAAEDRHGDLTTAWRATRAARKGTLRSAIATWVAEPLESHSRLYGLVRNLLVRLGNETAGSGGPPEPREFDAYASKVAGTDPNLLFPFRDGTVSTVLTPGARAAVLDLADPRVAEGLRLSLEALARIAARCGDRCRVAVVWIPTKELVYASRVRAAGVAMPPAYARLVDAESAMWARTQHFLDARSIPWIDTLAALRSALERGTPPYPPDWNGHPNAAGNEQIARAVLASGLLADGV